MISVYEIIAQNQFSKDSDVILNLMKGQSGWHIYVQKIQDTLHAKLFTKPLTTEYFHQTVAGDYDTEFFTILQKYVNNFFHINKYI